MRSYSQNNPTGNGSDADFFQKILRQLREELQFYDSETISWRMMPRGIVANVKSRSFGGQGDSWPPSELDASLSYNVGDWVYISPANPLATSGMMDLVLGIVVAAPAGLWRANRPVPASVVVSGIAKYNVPQLPTPGSVSGTPYSGDLDNPNVFWVRIERASLC
jgi:hypothetical protein